MPFVCHLPHQVFSTSCRLIALPTGSTVWAYQDALQDIDRRFAVSAAISADRKWKTRTNQTAGDTKAGQASDSSWLKIWGTCVNIKLPTIYINALVYTSQVSTVSHFSIRFWDIPPCRTMLESSAAYRCNSIHHTDLGLCVCVWA